MQNGNTQLGLGLGLTFIGGSQGGGVAPPGTFRLLLEDGVSFLLAEDGAFLRKEQNT